MSRIAILILSFLDFIVFVVFFFFLKSEEMYDFFNKRGYSPSIVKEDLHRAKS